MKSPRFIVLAALALACCAVPAFARHKTASDDNQAAAGEAQTKEMKGNDVASILEANERAINEAFKDRDAGAFMNLVEKDAWGVDGMGVHSISDLTDMMKDLEIKSYTLEGFRTQMLAKDLCVISYIARWDGSYKGQAMPRVPSFVSTVWAKRGGKWVGVFHQESMGMASQAMGSQN